MEWGCWTFSNFGHLINTSHWANKMHTWVHVWEIRSRKDEKREREIGPIIASWKYKKFEFCEYGGGQ